MSDETSRNRSYECEIELAMKRLERRIYSLNYDGYFTKSFFKEFEKVLSLSAAFRLFFLDSGIKIHAYHSKPDAVRSSDEIELINNLMISFNNKIGKKPSAVVESCADEYPGANSKIEINVCTCDQFCSLGSCDDPESCKNKDKIEGLIILYSENDKNAFQEFFDAKETFGNLRELFKKKEEPKCFGRPSKSCDKKCKWENLCKIRPQVKQNGINISKLDLDEVVQQLRVKIQDLLSQDTDMDQRIELPILIYDPLTRFLRYRAIKYMKLNESNDWSTYTATALNIIKDWGKELIIKDEIAFDQSILEGKKKNLIGGKKPRRDIYQEKYECLLKSLQEESFFKANTITQEAQELFQAAIQRVDTGLTKDIWNSFENFRIASTDQNKIPKFDKPGEKLRRLCEHLFLKMPKDEYNEINVIPIGYIGQKLGIIFSSLRADISKQIEDKFINISREFAPLLFNSLQSQIYRKSLQQLEKRHPKEAINILCEMLPIAFNVTAIVFRQEKSSIVYGFATGNEGEIFDLLEKGTNDEVINELIGTESIEFKTDLAYELRDFNNEDGEVYSSKQDVQDKKIRTRSRLLLGIDPGESHRDLPIEKGILDVFFDLSEYSLRRNAPDIVREIEFIADLIFEAANQKHAFRKKAIRTAVSAIMGRNMSHNIGSHVLARYSSAIKNDTGHGENKPDHRGDFLSYLQRRMDFLAEVATSDQAFWAQPLSVREQINKLNYKVQYELYFGESSLPVDCSGDQCVFTEQSNTINRPILLSYITGKESLIASVEFGLPDKRCLSYIGLLKAGYSVKPNEYDLMFSCPGGEVGVQALFIILENIIRNSARHGNNNGCSLVRIFVYIDEKKTTDDLIKLVVIDPRTKLAKDGRTMRPDPNGGFCPSYSDRTLTQELFEFQPKPSAFSLFDDEGKRKTLCRLPNNINSIIMDEPFLDPVGNPNPYFWGVREMQICAQYLRGEPLSEMESFKNNDYPLLRADIQEINDGEYCLKYEFYLQREKLVAVLGRIKSIPMKRVQVICVKKPANIDWEDISKKTLGYSFLVVDDKIDLPTNNTSNVSLPIRVIRMSLDEINKLINSINNSSPSDNSWIESLHRKACEIYTKKTSWKGKEYWGIIIYDNNLRPPTEQTDNELIWTKLDSNYSLLEPFPIELLDKLNKLTEENIAAAWLDHATSDEYLKINLEKYTYSSLWQAGRKIPDNMESHVEKRIWVSVEAAYSDSAHSGFLISDAHKGLKWELLAASLPRVLVLDERIQSARNAICRNISLGDVTWPNMGVWVPSKNKCNLDSPNLMECRCFLENPSERDDQFPADFFIVHLTILEKLKEKTGSMKKVLDSLIRDTVATEAHIVVVTGRGVPASAYSKGSDYMPIARYLPISALYESLVLRPSKLALMRALWSARCHINSNE